MIDLNVLKPAHREIILSSEREFINAAIDGYYINEYIKNIILDSSEYSEFSAIYSFRFSAMILLVREEFPEYIETVEKYLILKS